MWVPKKRFTIEDLTNPAEFPELTPNAGKSDTKGVEMEDQAEHSKFPVTWVSLFN